MLVGSDTIESSLILVPASGPATSAGGIWSLFIAGPGINITTGFCGLTSATLSGEEEEQ
jgi:hypothetical protein